MHPVRLLPGSWGVPSRAAPKHGHPASDPYASGRDRSARPRKGGSQCRWLSPERSPLRPRTTGVLQTLPSRVPALFPLTARLS